jgi:hypothetical protein
MIKNKREINIMKKGDKVKYTGKGFLGFCSDNTDMTILEVNPFDFLVNYNGQEVLVRNYEIEEI